MAWAIEKTDLFCGEANYSWVQRETIPSKQGESRRSLSRRIKAAVGLTGVSGRMTHYGDGGEFRPHGLLQVVFWNWSDNEEELI